MKLAEISKKDYRIEFQFSCRFAFFINFSSFKLDTENNAVSSKRNFDAIQ